MTRAETLIVLCCMHTRFELKTTKKYRPASLRIAIEYVGACYNLHYYPQMEQLDWSEITYYNISDVISTL